MNLERILLVGEDPNLIASRALLLWEWETETVDTFHAAHRIESQKFDLLIICQTVPDTTATLLIRAAKELKAPPEILVIRVEASHDSLGVETHLRDLWESPAWLRESAIALLGRRIPACL